MGVSIVHKRLFVPDVAKRDVKQLKHDIEWMPGRTCVQICLADATCHLNVRKSTPKSHLSDDMQVVWDAGAPRTCRDRRIVDQIVSEAYIFATCETLKLVAHKEPMTKLSLAMKAWKTLLCSSHVQLCKAASENKNISSTASEKEADQMADLADASVFAGAGECAAKLLDEAALSEEARAELNLFMVANPTKTLSLPDLHELNEFVLSGECELASTTLDEGISVLTEGAYEVETRLGEVLPHRHAIGHLLTSSTREAQR